MTKNLIEITRLFKPNALFSSMFPGRSPFRSRMLLSSLYVPKLTKHSNVKPLTYLEKSLSDHRVYTKGEGLSGNLMKQGRSKPNFTNNAFGLNETSEEYRARLNRLAETIIEKLQDNPHINNLSFQEAPIKEDYEYFKQILKLKLPDQWRFYNSDYGVLTILKTEKYQCEDISHSMELTAGMDFGTKDNRFKEDRFRTFKVEAEAEKPWILTNIHVPHDNPGAALKKLFVNVLKYHLDNVPQDGVKHIICGDWNSTPEEIDAAYEEACAEIEEQYQDTFHLLKQASIVSELASSVDGHQKSLKPGQDKPDVITVDGMLTINVNPDARYSNRSKHANFNKSPSVGLSILILSSMGALLSNKLSQKKAAPEKSSDESEELGNTPSADL